MPKVEYESFDLHRMIYCYIVSKWAY